MCWVLDLIFKFSQIRTRFSVHSTSEDLFLIVLVQCSFVTATSLCLLIFLVIIIALSLYSFTSFSSLICFIVTAILLLCVCVLYAALLIWNICRQQYYFILKAFGKVATFWCFGRRFSFNFILQAAFPWSRHRHNLNYSDFSEAVERDWGKFVFFVFFFFSGSQSAVYFPT